MMKLNRKSIFSVLLVFILLFSFVFSNAVITSAQTLSELQDEQSDLQSKIKESEDKVTQLESERAEQSEIISELNSQIDKLNRELNNVHSQQDVINGKISAVQSEIDKLNDEISELDEQIDEKDKEIDETVNLYCERMRANYITGNVSLLQMFSESTGMVSFLNRIELFKRVVDNDQKLVNKLNDEIAEIEKLQNQLEEKKQTLQNNINELEKDKSELVATENQLSTTQAEIVEKSRIVNEKLASLNYQTQQLQISIEDYQAEFDAIDNQIAAFLREQESKKSYNSSSSGSGSYSSPETPSSSSSGWIWPVPYSSSYISSPYGYRVHPIYGEYSFHSGIDITMGDAYGKDIVATKSGVVIFCDCSDTSGYGNYLMVDHGGGYVSLYAHCSSICVSEGQSVSAGQTIAYIGTSGWSTGPHLHFEIRYDGETVNPCDYV